MLYKSSIQNPIIEQISLNSFLIPDKTLREAINILFVSLIRSSLHFNFQHHVENHYIAYSICPILRQKTYILVNQTVKRWR